MKNLKTLLGFGILMGALMVNTTFAGIMMSDAAPTSPCESADNYDTRNVSVVDVIIVGIKGVLFGDKAPCSDNNANNAGLQGIMISD